MHVISSVFFLLGASRLVRASPVDSTFENLDFEAAEVFKRDAVLDARDIELAERHNVNLTEMRKHSFIKRDDGDDVTIWVSNDYVEPEDEDKDQDAADDSLDKRQNAIPQSGFRSGPEGTNCNYGRTYNGDTGPNAPFTGGAAAIINWGNRNRGSWRYTDRSTPHQWRNLIIGGTNSGRNMRFTVRLASRSPMQEAGITFIGAHDVRDITRGIRDRFQQSFNGRWRVRGWGNFRCFAHRTVQCGPTGGQSCFVPWQEGFDYAIDHTAGGV